MTDKTNEVRDVRNGAHIPEMIAVALSPDALKQIGKLTNTLIQADKDVTKADFDAAVPKIAAIIANDLDTADGKAADEQIEKSVLVTKAEALAVLAGKKISPQEIRQMLDKQVGEGELISVEDATQKLTTMLRPASENMFSLLDGNHDGVLNKSDTMIRAAERINSRAKKNDYLTPDELKIAEPARDMNEAELGELATPKVKSATPEKGHKAIPARH